MSDGELQNIKGGATWQAWTISISVISFLIGVLQGFFERKKC